MTENEKKPTPPSVWYLLWLGLTIAAALTHWLYPLIVFAIGAVWLHNSPHGEPLRRVVDTIQTRWKLPKQQAQGAALAAGLFLTGLATPVVLGVQHQQEAKEMARREQELAVARQQQAASEAREREAAARAAAEKAAAERVKAEAAAKAAQEAETRRQKDEQDRIDRQAQWQDQQRENQRRKDQQATQRQEQKRQDDEANEQQRRAAEGPFTRDQAENMCRDEIAKPYGVDRMAVHQQGSYVEKQDASIKNMEFGAQRVWNWEATFNIAGTDIMLPVQCTVFESGEVKVGAQ